MLDSRLREIVVRARLITGDRAIGSGYSLGGLRALKLGDGLLEQVQVLLLVARADWLRGGRLLVAHGWTARVHALQLELHARLLRLGRRLRASTASLPRR